MYDKGGEEHYNIISALHKSIRNGDAGRCDLLAGAHARRRRRSAVHRPATGAGGFRGCGKRRPQALILAVRVKEATHFIGNARGRRCPRPTATYLAAARVECCLCRIRRSGARGAAGRQSACPPAHPQRSHPPDAGAWLWPRLSVRTRFRRADRGDGMPSGVAGGRRFYEPKGLGLERRSGSGLEQDAKRAARGERASGKKVSPLAGWGGFPVFTHVHVDHCASVTSSFCAEPLPAEHIDHDLHGDRGVADAKSSRPEA